VRSMAVCCRQDRLSEAPTSSLVTSLASTPSTCVGSCVGSRASGPPGWSAMEGTCLKSARSAGSSLTCTRFGPSSSHHALGEGGSLTGCSAELPMPQAGQSSPRRAVSPPPVHLQGSASPMFPGRLPTSPRPGSIRALPGLQPPRAISPVRSAPASARGMSPSPRVQSAGLASPQAAPAAFHWRPSARPGIHPPVPWAFVHPVPSDSAAPLMTPPVPLPVASTAATQRPRSPSREPVWAQSPTTSHRVHSPISRQRVQQPLKGSQSQLITAGYATPDVPSRPLLTGIGGLATRATVVAEKPKAARPRPVASCSVDIPMGTPRMPPLVVPRPTSPKAVTKVGRSRTAIRPNTACTARGAKPTDTAGESLPAKQQQQQQQQRQPQHQVIMLGKRRYCTHRPCF